MANKTTLTMTAPDKPVTEPVVAKKQLPQLVIDVAQRVLLIQGKQFIRLFKTGE